MSSKAEVSAALALDRRPVGRSSSVAQICVRRNFAGTPRGARLPRRVVRGRPRRRSQNASAAL